MAISLGVEDVVNAESGGLFGGLDLGGLITGGAALGSALLPYLYGQDPADYLKQQLTTLPTTISGIETGALGELAFKPFTLTTGAGTTNIATDPATGLPSLSLGLAPEMSALQQSLFGQAQTLAGTAGPTAEQLFQQLQATRAPETERARLALENRLAAQGRLGTQTAAFGGTPEALALEKAIQEQQSKDLFGTQTLAQELEKGRLANITGLLAGAFAPEEQLLSGLATLAPLSQMGTDVSKSRAQLLRDLGITEVEAVSGLLGNLSTLEADRLKALSQALSGMFASGEDGSSVAGDAVDSLINWLGEKLG